MNRIKFLSNKGAVLDRKQLETYLEKVASDHILKKQADKNGKSKYICVTPGSASFGERYARALQDGMVSIDQADNLVVIKTVSGMAMAVAAAIDALEIEEIVGSIAGDDTIMCAVRTADLVPAVIEKISNK